MAVLASRQAERLGKRLLALHTPPAKVRAFRNGKNDDWVNMLIFGDNLQVLNSLLEMKKEGKLKTATGLPGIKLIYIDPPFATKQEFEGSHEEKAY